jgi:hypothetical protein
MLGDKKSIPDDMLFLTRLKGRVSGSEHINAKAENGGFFQTVVTVPAPDEYSHPTTYFVNASAPLGPDKQNVDVVCEVRPYNRRVNGKIYPNNSLWLYTGDNERQGGPF